MILVCRLETRRTNKCVAGNPDTTLIISTRDSQRCTSDRRRMLMDLLSRAVTLSALLFPVNRGADAVICSDVVISPSVYGSCLKIEPLDVG